MPNLVSQLTLRLVDDVTGKAGRASGGLDKLGAALESAAKRAKALGEAGNFTTRFINSVSKLGLSAREIERVSAAMKDFQRLNNIGADPGKWTRQHITAMRAWEGQTVSALKRVARAQAEAMGGGSRRPGMGAVAGMGLGYMASHAGAAAAVIGPGYLLHKGAAARARFAHEGVRAQVSGMTSVEIAEAIQEAGKLQQDNKAFDLATILHLLRNSRSIVGSYKEAAHIADPLLKLRTVALGANPERKEELEADFDKLVKGMEIKGVTQDMPRFKHYIDGMAKAMNVFGDTLRPTDYYEMFKYGRASTQGLSDDYMLSIAPTLAQELGGSSTGKAHSAFYSAIVGGKMTNPAVQEMNKLGLIDPKKVIKTKTGNIKGIAPGGIVGSDLAQANPYEWVQQILAPALSKHGVSDPVKIGEIMARVFSNATAAQLVTIFLNQRSRIEKDRALGRGAKGTDAANDYATKDPYIAWENLKASAASLAEASGGLASVVRAMNGAAEILSNLAKRYLEIFGPGANDNKEMIQGENLDKLNSIFGRPSAKTLDAMGNSEAAAAVTAKKMRDRAVALGPDGDALTQGLSDKVFELGMVKQKLRGVLESPFGIGGGKASGDGGINPVGAFGLGRGGLSEILEKAGEAKKKLGALEETVTPNINTASIDAAITKGQQLKTILASLGALADGAATSAARATSFVDT